MYSELETMTSGNFNTISLGEYCCCAFCPLHVMALLMQGGGMQAENWNGRAAMVGFAGILITEALSGKTIPSFYGLPHGGF